MDKFLTKLENRRVVLADTADPVRYSFIVQNSLSSLNLDLCEYSELSDTSRTALDIANDFVNTEEKCRKIFTPSRALFYCLNLDLPSGREYSLKNDLKPCKFSRSFDIPHVAKMQIECGFEYRIMSNCIEAALKVTDRKLKILEMLVMSPVLNRNILHLLEIHVMNNFIDCFYPKITNSVVFKGFIENLNLAKWMCIYEKPELLKFLLYQAHRHEIIIDEERCTFALIDDCILRRFFLNIEPLLQYTYTRGYCFDSYDLYVSKISSLRPNLTRKVYTKALKCLMPKRIYLILQIFWIYLESSQHGCTEAASEALRLLWMSSLHPCISFEEVQKVFGKALIAEEQRDMYRFYCSSIGEIPSHVEPRSLKQLCRTEIRRTFWENKVWIPEGVRLTGLPEFLQSFLNLKKCAPILLILDQLTTVSKKRRSSIGESSWRRPFKFSKMA